MNFTLFPNSHSPIGVDVGAASIKAAQLDRSNAATTNAESQAKTVILPRQAPGQPLHGAEVRRLGRVLARQGFQGNRLTLATPDANVITETLTLPPPDCGAPRDQLARAEIARIRQLDPSEFEIGFWEVPTPARGGDAGHVTACACKHADSEPWLDKFESQGFDVVGLDVKPCILARACRRLNETSDGIVGLIDLGWQAARLVLIHQSAVVFARSNLEAGMGKLHAMLAKQFNLAQDEVEHVIRHYGLSAGDWSPSDRVPPQFAAVQSRITSHLDHCAKDLSRSLTYARHRYPDNPLRSVRLVGGGAAIPGAAKHLTQALEVEVATIDAHTLGISSVAVKRAPSVCAFGSRSEPEPEPESEFRADSQRQDARAGILATAVGLANQANTDEPRIQSTAA